MRKILLTAFAVIMMFAAAPVMAASEVAPASVAGATTVDAKQAMAALKAGAFVLDPRSKENFDGGHLPKALHMDSKCVSTCLSEQTIGKLLPSKEAKILVYCNGEACLRSSEVAAKLVGWGYKGVLYFRDGVPGWEKAGFPLVK